MSWFLLKGKCRYCKKPISVLYPLVEFFTAVLITVLFFNTKNLVSFFAYFIFFSALIVATRTDLEGLVIPQIFSLWLVPVGFIFSYFNFLNINFIQSLSGAVFGYGILWITAKLFKLITKKDGLGVGDMELLALIGAFTGPLGIWISLLVGSFVGLFVSGGYILIFKKSIKTRIPFGPFLSVGAIVYFFFKSYFILFLLG